MVGFCPVVNGLVMWHAKVTGLHMKMCWFYFPGAGGLGAPEVSCGPVSQLVLPVLDRGEAPAGFRGAVPGDGGVGPNGLPDSPGAPQLPAVR